MSKTTRPKHDLDATAPAWGCPCCTGDAFEIPRSASLLEAIRRRQAELFPRKAAAKPSVVRQKRSRA